MAIAEGMANAFEGGIDMPDVTALEAHVELRRLVVEYADEGLDHGQIYEKIEANHLDVVDAFIASQRRALVVQAIRMIVGSKRRQRIHQARFAAAEDKIEAGENLFVSSFPAADGGRKSLVEMTKDDLIYAAEWRDRQGAALVDEARLLRQIARKVPRGKTVGDVYSAEQITTLVQRFGKVTE